MQATTIILILSLNVGTMAVPLTLPAWAQQTVDHSIYGELLKSHVKHGLVDYRGFKKDEAQAAILNTTGRSTVSSGTIKIEIFIYKNEPGIHRRTLGGEYGKQL